MTPSYEAVEVVSRLGLTKPNIESRFAKRLSMFSKSLLMIDWIGKDILQSVFIC